MEGGWEGGGDGLRCNRERADREWRDEGRRLTWEETVSQEEGCCRQGGVNGEGKVIARIPGKEDGRCGWRSQWTNEGERHSGSIPD